MRLLATFPNNSERCHREEFADYVVSGADRAKSESAARSHHNKNKETWLTLHGKACSDLYGMLLLVKGMPVMLQDYVSRKKEFSSESFFRGCGQR